jgi:hypothetical protein
MKLETTASRLWKRLTPEERQAASRAFWSEPAHESTAQALAAIVKARRVRPQVARSMPAEEQARVLASILDPGETVAASLLVALHMGDRRPMLGAFLDALGMQHEDGILKDDPGGSATDEGVRAAAERLLAAHPARDVVVYLNTLWLQDPERWGAIERLPDPADDAGR